MRLVNRDDSTVQLVNERTGEVMDWDVSVFDRTRFNSIEDPFRDINGYWKFIGPERQERIWNIYKQIHGVWSTANDTTALTRQLISLVAALYDEMPQQELEHWVKFHGKIRYPDNLRDEHDIEDPNPGRTYLRVDYQGLVVLCVAVRPMVPIWGELINRIKNEVGSIYKEYTAMKLLAKSWIISSSYIERLRLYVESSNLHTASNVAAILSGLGTDELPDFLLSFAVVRRAAVGDIDASDVRGSIISNIYGFISSTLKDLDRKFGGGLKEKHAEDTGIDDEGSLVEAYKVKSETTAGEIMMFSTYVERYMNMAHRIDPTIDSALVKLCVDNALTLHEMFVSPHQLTLTQWLLASVLPTKAVPMLNKTNLLIAMGTAQAVLWHWGFKEPACLITATKVIQEKELILTNDVRKRINAEMTQRLNQLYPHVDQNERTTVGRRNNLAFNSVMVLTGYLEANPWTIRAPAQLVNDCPGINARGVMICPPDIVETLVKLVFKLNE